MFRYIKISIQTLATVLLIGTVACSSTELIPQPNNYPPDQEATIEAKFAQELAIEARVKQELASRPTPEPEIIIREVPVYVEKEVIKEVIVEKVVTIDNCEK